MAVSSPAGVSVGDAAAVVVATGNSGGGGATVELYNSGSHDVWVGGSTVAFGTVGVLLAKNTSKAYTLRAGDVLYAIAGSGNTTTITSLVLSGSY